MQSSTALSALVAVSLTVCAASASARDKTDVIVLKNGDRVTGEILELEYGLLRLATDDMGTVSIEWSAIASIDSQYAFDVQRAGGRQYAGVIATSEDGEELVIRDEHQRGVRAAVLRRARDGARNRFLAARFRLDVRWVSTTPSRRASARPASTSARSIRPSSSKRRSTSARTKRRAPTPSRARART